MKLKSCVIILNKNLIHALIHIFITNALEKINGNYFYNLFDLRII
jgi:hypothetical protein